MASREAVSCALGRVCVLIETPRWQRMERQTQAPGEACTPSVKHMLLKRRVKGCWGSDSEVMQVIKLVQIKMCGYR